MASLTPLSLEVPRAVAALSFPLALLISSCCPSSTCSCQQQQQHKQKRGGGFVLQKQPAKKLQPVCKQPARNINKQNHTVCGCSLCLLSPTLQPGLRHPWVLLALQLALATARAGFVQGAELGRGGAGGCWAALCSPGVYPGWLQGTASCCQRLSSAFLQMLQELGLLQAGSPTTREAASSRGLAAWSGMCWLLALEKRCSAGSPRPAGSYLSSSRASDLR